MQMMCLNIMKWRVIENLKCNDNYYYNCLRSLIKSANTFWNIRLSFAGIYVY